MDLLSAIVVSSLLAGTCCASIINNHDHKVCNELCQSANYTNDCLEADYDFSEAKIGPAATLFLCCLGHTSKPLGSAITYMIKENQINAIYTIVKDKELTSVDVAINYAGCIRDCHFSRVDWSIEDVRNCYYQKGGRCKIQACPKV